MARNDKSITHRSLSSSPHTVIVSFLISYLRLVVFSFLLSNRLAPRLVSSSIVSSPVLPRSSCYCVSYLYAVVPIRAAIVSVIYHHTLIYPFIIPSLPFPIAPPTLPHHLIASSYPTALSISSSPSPLPDGKIELTQTARSFCHRHQPNRITRREATGTRTRRHEMRKTSYRRHVHETQRAR